MIKNDVLSHVGDSRVSFHVRPSFAGDPGKANSFDPDPRFLDEKVIEWKERRAIATAADAVACGVTTGRVEIVGEPAQFLLDNDDKVTPHVRQLAEYALRALDPERPRDAEADLPPLSTTKTYAISGVRMARARLSRDPRNLLAYLDLSRAYTILGQRSQALAAMQNALRVAPDHRYALRTAARLFVHIGEPDRAFRLLADNARTPDDPWLIAPAIAIATIADRPPRFVRRAHELIERRGYGAQDLTEVYGALGTLEYYAGRHARARRAFRSSLISPTENVVAQARWAGTRLAGIDIGEEAWKLPRSYEAWCWRAVDDGSWSKAIQFCSQWVQDEPFSSRPAILGSYIGIGLVAEPAYSEACARVGLRADPADQTLLNNLTVALAYQDKLEDAEATLGKITGEASESYPKYVHSATAGLLEFRRGNIIAGRALYEEAHQCAPREKKSRVLVYWAKEELQAGTERASKLVQEAADLTARDGDAHTIRLLEVFFGLGRP